MSEITLTFEEVIHAPTCMVSKAVTLKVVREGGGLEALAAWRSLADPMVIALYRHWFLWNNKT